MGKNIFLTIAVCACAFFSSCSSSEDFLADNTGNGATKVFSTNIIFEAESGEKEDNITRGIGDQGFTNDYPYEYIYVHSTTDKSKTLKVKLKEVEYCDDCRGIQLRMVIKDGEDGYTLYNDQGRSITLAEDEEVYFSSYPSTIWEATPLEQKTPVSGKDVFSKNDDVNIELLRSELTYGKAALEELLQAPAPQVLLKRHCTGFAINFMFTNVDAMGGPDMKLYTVTSENWSTYIPNASPDDFYIKLYVGPNFCHTYNIFADTTPEGDKGGYYVIQNNQYVALTNFTFTNSGLTTPNPVIYSGFGYRTAADDILVAPLNTAMNLNNFAVYVFVKYAPDGTDVNSDAGALYLKIPIEDMTFTLNRIHNFVLCLDINELKHVIEKTEEMQATTRSYWDSPIELKLEHPVIVKHLYGITQVETKNQY